MSEVVVDRAFIITVRRPVGVVVVVVGSLAECVPACVS
jgi:hypothetical protein